MRLLVLTLLGLLILGCARQQATKVPMSKGATMTYSVGTQADLDATNQRINQFKQDLLQRGFHDESRSISDASEEFILAGQYGTLSDLRVTLRTARRMQSDPPPFAGGIHASVKDEQADREFNELYEKVCSVVTGQAETCRNGGY